MEHNASVWRSSLINYLIFKETILQGLLFWVVSSPSKQSLIFCIVLSHTSDLLVVISTCKGCQTIWVQLATFREESSSILLSKFRIEGIDCDNKGSAVGFKLKSK